MQHMAGISTFFTSLIAESIGLPVDAFDRFFDRDQQHKLKIVKYPEVDLSALPPSAPPKQISEARQGVGPHKDSMLTSYLLQASPQKGLQAQNQNGDWIDCEPLPGTLVVAIGQGMEALTGGCCASTTHRVLSPEAGQGPRYSVPFFQGVSYDAKFEEMAVPEAMKTMAADLRRRRGGRKDDVEFTFVKGRWGHLGEATLMNRIKSHPDVGERWVSLLSKPMVVANSLFDAST
jgi:isopenicillin N synthase-like dioxygenase